MLGEFVLPAGRPVWTATLIDLLADLGVAEKAARQAIMRTADSGWIEPRAASAGRPAGRSPTRGPRLLREGTDRIYGFAADGAPGTAGGCAHRRRRRRTAGRCGSGCAPGWAGRGWARVSPATWVTPRVDREARARAVLEELGLLGGQLVVRGDGGAIGDERSLARAAWDLDAVERRYEEFLELVGRRRPRTDRQALVAQVRLVQEWRRFPLLDPGLPRELLPPRWSGNRAAEVFRERHAAWAPRRAARPGRS